MDASAWWIAVSLFVGMLLYPVVLRKWPKGDHVRSGILAATIVLTGSVVSLLTRDEPGSLRYRWHIGLIALMVMAIGLGMRKLRRA